MFLQHSRDRPGSGSRSPGFSLVELLLAISLGSLLLVSLAGSAQVFSGLTEDVRNEDGEELQRALVTVLDDIQGAWLVERPSDTRLVLTDALDRDTTYFLDDGALKVTRPSGATGVLLDGVADASFVVERTRRYVDAPSDSDYDTVFATPVPAGAPVPFSISGGEALAIAFHIPVAAPAGVSPLEDVQEQILDVSLDRMVLSISFFDGSPLEFCHLHASGPPHSASHASGTADLALDLYEARYAGDTRPYGAVLETAAVPTTSLPPIDYRWLDLTTETAVTPPEVIDPPSGVAWGWWDDHALVSLDVDTPAPVEVPVDLSSLSTPLEPGKAYVLVIRVSGVDFVTVPVYPLASTVGANVSFRAGSAASFVPQALALPLRIEGTRRCTQTEARDVVSRVTATLVLQDGESVTGSGVVMAQSAVTHPWLGPVPDDSPSLLLAGQ